MPRILIVKGPGESFHRIKDVLANAQFKVWEVESGDEAVQVGPTIAPALILVSIVLPNSNGLEVAARLRNLPALSAAKIVLLGHLIPLGINQEPLSSLVAGYLDVDSSDSYLINYVKTHLGKSSA